MLNSTEYKITTSHRNKMLKKNTFLAFKMSNHVFNMVVNIELPASYDILTFMKMKAFVLR